MNQHGLADIIEYGLNLAAIFTEQISLFNKFGCCRFKCSKVLILTLTAGDLRNEISPLGALSAGT